MFGVELVCIGNTRCFVGFLFFFQAEDGIRDLVRSRGLGDVYKRQVLVAAGAVGVRRDGLRLVLQHGVGEADDVGDVEALSLIHI